MDNSIYGCMVYLKDFVGDYSVGLFLTDIAFREKGFHPEHEKRKEGYYEHLVRDHVQPYFDRLTNIASDQSQGLSGLEMELKKSRANVKRLDLKERFRKGDVHHLGSIILLDILTKHDINKGNFDEKAERVIRLIGSYSLQIGKRDSDFRPGVSYSQYRHLMAELPKKDYKEEIGKPEIKKTDKL